MEEETADAKIERLVTEIDELKASLIGVPEMSDEWFRIKTDIKDRDIERLILIEKKRCDGVVEEYFKENPHVLEAVPECPICLEKMWDLYMAVRYVCCGKLICKKCDVQGGDALLTCPLCRGKAPGSAEITSITKEKADLGIAWAQVDLGEKYFHGYDGVPKDVEKALPLLSEAAEKGSAKAKTFLGQHYLKIRKYEEARRWFVAAAAEGEVFSLYQLGRMMRDGLAFDQNEETRTNAFHLFTVAGMLYQGTFSGPAVQLSSFFRDSPSVMLHYLRPALEEEGTGAGVFNFYARGLISAAKDYYGKYYAAVVGHSPVPEAMFWYWEFIRRNEEPDANHPLAEVERQIRETCAHCQADLPEDNKSCCIECKAAYYCNRECQVAHWKAGHKKDCVKKLKKRLRAEGKLDERGYII